MWPQYARVVLHVYIERTISRTTRAKTATTILLACSMLSFTGFSTANAAVQDENLSSVETVEVSENQANLNIDIANENGFEATVENGSVQENEDGSLSILNAGNIESGVLQSTITLDDGSTRSVEYEVQGSDIKATYSGEVGEEQNAAMPSGATMSSSGVDCALALATAGGGYLGAAGAALTAPCTAGGGLVVSGAAVGAATAGVNGAYQCYGWIRKQALSGFF